VSCTVDVRFLVSVGFSEVSVPSEVCFIKSVITVVTKE